jgi:hypothetical protein
MSARFQQELERRQNRRIRCGGTAKIISLPSEGLWVPGKVLNLSVGGCGIETASPLSAGTLAEIVLRVNAASIRVLGEVSAHRDPRVVGVEFRLVSAYGKDLLTELMEELAKRQIVANFKKPVRDKSEFDTNRRKLSVLLHGSSQESRTMASLDKPASSGSPTADTLCPAPGDIPSIFNGDELDVFV